MNPMPKTTNFQLQALDRRDWHKALNILFDKLAEMVKRIKELEAKPALASEIDELLNLLEVYITEKEAQMKAGYRYGPELTRIVELYRIIRPKKEA